MTAQDLIAFDIPALSLEQTGRDAFHLLNDYHVMHLPVLDGKRLIGIISEEDIFNHKLYDPISEYDFSMMRHFSVQPKEHLFEVMRVMGENRLTVIPVADEEGNYLGIISQNSILRAFANTTAFVEPGGIIVLEMGKHDYVLSNIARIVEEDDAHILSAFVTSAPDADMIEVTLKINRHDLFRIAASLERRDYVVKNAYTEDAYSDGMKERYDSLMNYLNM